MRSSPATDIDPQSLRWELRPLTTPKHPNHARTFSYLISTRKHLQFNLLRVSQLSKELQCVDELKPLAPVEYMQR